MTIKLEEKEKQLIREITAIQLEDLIEIRNQDCEEDITLFCIQSDIQQEDLMDCLDYGISTFEELLHYPERFVFLEEEDMRVFKHILFNIKGFKRAKQKIATKLILMEFIDNHQN